jgi:hypothetical protein
MIATSSISFLFQDLFYLDPNPIRNRISNINGRHKKIQKNLDGLVEVPEEGVEPQQSHQREVAQHLVQRVSPKVASHLKSCEFLAGK